jgi:four helix bundle protein
MSHPVAPGPARNTAPVLDADKLDVYHVSLELQALVAGLLRRCPLSLRDQLDRASVSIVLNTAEGAGRRSKPDKARFFTIARASAAECGALLDLLKARVALSDADYRHARSLVVRIAQMLTSLMRRHGQLLP